MSDKKLDIVMGPRPDSGSGADIAKIIEGNLNNGSAPLFDGEISAAAREKAKKIKLFASDLDGTLLGDDKLISEYTSSVIRRAMEAGYYFTFATGQQADRMWYFMPSVPANAPVICSNGGELVDIKTGQVYFRSCIDVEAARDFADFCMKRDISFILRTPDEEFANESCSYIPRMKSRQQLARDLGGKVQGLMIITDREDERLCGKQFIKLMAWPKNEDEKQAVTEFCDSCAAVDLTFSDPSVMEIMPAGTNKGLGIKRLCELLGLTAQEVCVFGDFLNDRPMFCEAGMAVAMGNACDEIKAMADYVSTTNNEGGVAAAIERLFLS